MPTIDRPRPHLAVLELQARARDHALAERVERLERTVARVHARLDGAMVTVVAPIEARARQDAEAKAAQGASADPHR
ncbi:MAG: hypothetical protein OEV60_13970 [Actinomycetota bacterium]|nr:hypothetical protein [Actinomycetota bacterium]